MDGSEPVWSPDEHLDRTYRRGRQLRRRRRLITVGGPLLAVAAAAFGISALTGSTPARHVQTLAQPRTTTTVRAGEPGTAGATASGGGTGTPTTVAPAGGGGGSPGTPSPGAKGGTTPTTSGSGGATPVTTSPTSTPVSTSPAITDCAPSDLDYSTTTDKASYSAGEAVTISIVLRNHSSRTCDAPNICGVGPWAAVLDASGSEVWHNNPIAAMCTNPPPAKPRLGPGQSHSYTTASWDQKACTANGSSCSHRAPTGKYRAVAHWGNNTATPAKFTLV
jgi:hypothetical protein